MSEGGKRKEKRDEVFGKGKEEEEKGKGKKWMVTTAAEEKEGGEHREREDGF